MSYESFGDMVDRHMQAGTCYLCGKKVHPGVEPLHGLTGAHWDCHEKEVDDFHVAEEKAEKAMTTLRKFIKEGKLK